MIVEETVNILSHDERKSIVMKNFTGLTLEEIANLRSISKNTAALCFNATFLNFRSPWNPYQKRDRLLMKA